MALYEYEKYITTPEKLRETLDQYGVAIIPSVLDKEECLEMQNGMWNTLEHWTQNWEQPIKCDNAVSWRDIRNLFPLHSMLIHHHGLAYAQFIWNLRQNKKCIEPFANLWGCAPEDLLVSFDGASFHMPPEITNIGWHRKTWYHCDQSYTRNGFECVQSWVTGFDVNEGDATLAFYEQSHKYQAQFAQHFNISEKNNWYRLESPEQIKFYTDYGCLERHIKCPRGSMVFWDSRTIHCGVEAQKGRPRHNFRCVVYLCYMPRQLCTQAELKKKQKAFEDMRMTSHWPCKVKLFPKTPRTYGAELKEVVAIDKPVLNELGLKLAGF
jgi:ectoine hydroxylase-related dioxygenase (phytanoyl-CoA dioxygenase family)